VRPGYGRGHDSYPRLAKRAISFAIAEADEDLAVARLAFLAHGELAVLDQAIDASLARTERTLYTRWRGHQLPGQGPLQGPADRIMFSTDYPYGSMTQAHAFLDQLPVSPADKERIAHGNAERLLRL
jgi:hypothetical protein